MIEINTYRSKAFANIVERIWFLSNDDETAEVMIPPNQYVNVVIPLGDSWYRFNNEVIVEPQIEGVSLKSHKIYYPSNCKFIGIRFYPFGIHPTFNIDGASISSKSVQLLPLTNEASYNIIKKISDSDNVEIQISLLEKLISTLFDIKRFEQVKKIKEYYQYFRGGNEGISIQDFCMQNGTNYTSLNRQFNQIVGISPKRFERLIKFRKALCELVDSHNNLTEIGANSGYYDQAHFIREFKLFLDYKPSSYHKLIKEADKESQAVNYNFRLF